MASQPSQPSQPEQQSQQNVLNLRMDDALKLLACNTHLGTQNVDFQMESYVYKRRPDGEGMK